MTEEASEASAAAERVVDSWRFTGSFLSGLLAAQIPETPTHDAIPWAPFEIPLARAKVALLSTAGISMKGERPFDMEMERNRPTRGDPSWRPLSAGATSADVEVNHLHIDTGYIERDLNVALPLDRLREAVGDGFVGTMAETHYSIMGYQGSDTRALEEESAPAIAASLLEEGVDALLLAPV